nr:hypothetical protein Iba_scaffold1262551CG0010 [Ipomoea batatas]
MDQNVLTDEHIPNLEADRLGSEKEVENRKEKTEEEGSSRAENEQRSVEDDEVTILEFAQLSDDDIRILMDNGFKKSIYSIHAQHKAAVVALRLIKAEKLEMENQNKVKDHHPLDDGQENSEGGNGNVRAAGVSQSIPIGPIAEKYKNAMEGHKLDINSERSFPGLKDHQPLDGGPRVSEEINAKEKGVKFAGETTYYFERGQPSGSKHDQEGEPATEKGTGGANATSSSVQKEKENTGVIGRGRTFERRADEGGIRGRSTSQERRSKMQKQNTPNMARGGYNEGQNFRGRGGRFGGGRGNQNNQGGRGEEGRNQSGWRNQNQVGMSGEKEDEVEELRKLINESNERERVRELEMEQLRALEKKENYNKGGEAA